jgi:hypothetical protein
LTFTEGALLAEQYRLREERQDRRAALAAWVLANAHRDPDVRREAFDLEDIVSWLGHGFQRRQEAEPAEAPSVETLVERAHMLQHVYSANGADAGHGQDTER